MVLRTRPNIWYMAPTHQVVDPSFLLLTHTPRLYPVIPLAPPLAATTFFSFLLVVAGKSPRFSWISRNHADWKVAEHVDRALCDAGCVNTRVENAEMRCTGLARPIALQKISALSNFQFFIFVFFYLIFLHFEMFQILEYVINRVLKRVECENMWDSMTTMIKNKLDLCFCLLYLKTVFISLIKLFIFFLYSFYIRCYLNQIFFWFHIRFKIRCAILFPHTFSYFSLLHTVATVR